MITKLLAVLFCIAVSVTITCITMIHGWGLVPRSWGVIIGVGVFGHLFVSIVSRQILEDVSKGR